jgi:fatty acid-binding protein DegV
MRDIRICTDSTALFPEGLALPNGATVVAVGIALDGAAYEPGDVDDFYSRLLDGARATSSAPSPGDFLDAYSAAAAGGADEIVSIHLDARVSATVSSAELAAREAPIGVTVVDSETVSFGLGACVSAAAEVLSNGGSVAEAVHVVRRLAPRFRSLFVAPAAPAGRVRAGRDWTIHSFSDGVVAPLVACRSEAEAAELMASTILSAPGARGVAVGHASARVEPWAGTLAERLGADPGVAEVLRYRLAEAVGVHTGPFCFGAFWWPRS